jgi:hypothetical protein
MLNERNELEKNGNEQGFKIIVFSFLIISLLLEKYDRMKKSKYSNISVIILFFCLSVFYSCLKYKTDAQLILTEAEKVMNDYPDSALSLLNRIEDPKLLKTPLYYEYINIFCF